MDSFVVEAIDPMFGTISVDRQADHPFIVFARSRRCDAGEANVHRDSPVRHDGRKRVYRSGDIRFPTTRHSDRGFTPLVVTGNICDDHASAAPMQIAAGAALNR